MVYSSVMSILLSSCSYWKVSFCSCHIWLQFSHQVGYGSNVIRLDSGHFWSLQLMFLCILSNALLMSRRSRYTVSSADDIVLLIIGLVANTCSVVHLFLRYAAWDMLLFIIQTANIFQRTDKRIVGRRFDVGPFGFPGFCSALKIPCVISFGCFPVTALLL